MPINLPNFITIGRILLVPVTVWLIVSGEFLLAFAGLYGGRRQRRRRRLYRQAV